MCLAFSLSHTLLCHSFIIYANFSVKVTFLTPVTHIIAYQGVINVAFSEDFAYVLNE